jgi:DNA repair exonuclease SbcCD ATPase subunit
LGRIDKNLNLNSYPNTIKNTLKIISTIIYMSKKVKSTLEDVFEFPPKKEEKVEDDTCCKVAKRPHKHDPEFEKDVKNYLADVKEAVAAEKTAPKRKNNVSEEGRKQMLANLKKGRETRKINLNKMHELRQQELKAEIDEVKNLLKANAKPDPKVEEQKKEEVKQEIVKIEPKVISPPPVVVKPYIIHSTFKKPAW